MVAARFIADTETQRSLSEAFAKVIWDLTGALDPEVQAAFILGDGVRAEVLRHLRRFGFEPYANLIGRNTAPRLSGAEIHELWLRAVGMGENDYDITDEYQYSD